MHSCYPRSLISIPVDIPTSMAKMKFVLLLICTIGGSFVIVAIGIFVICADIWFVKVKFVDKNDK